MRSRCSGDLAEVDEVNRLNRVLRIIDHEKSKWNNRSHHHSSRMMHDGKETGAKQAKYMTVSTMDALAVNESVAGVLESN